jgi:hypothetical protein
MQTLIKGAHMSFESIDIKRVKNGFVVGVIESDTGEFNEFVFSSSNQVLKFVKTQLNDKEND